jgi:hypothetical protein
MGFPPQRSLFATDSKSVVSPLEKPFSTVSVKRENKKSGNSRLLLVYEK